MIDILMAVYNGEKYIKDQIDSIINQTISNWRLVILDDCSTDSTLDILNKYRQKYPEKIVVHINEKNSGGAKENFFKLVKFAKYNYIMFCDHDDVWKKDKIEKTYRCMLELEQKLASPKEPLLVHTDLSVVDEKLNLIDKSMVKAQKLNVYDNRLCKLLSQGNVTGCTMMVNANLLNMMGEFSEGIIMHDWWASLIASAFGKMAFLNDPTILYRQHQSNQVGAKKVSSLKYILNTFFNFKKVKKSIIDKYNQAELFYKTYGEILNSSQEKVLKVYSNMMNYSKIKRIYYLFKYDFLMYGTTRKIGQILFC